MTDRSDNSLTVSIVAYRTAQEELFSMLRSLEAALQLLREKGEPGDLSVTLVDNSEDSALHQDLFIDLNSSLRAIKCEFNFIQGHGNVGYGAAHNKVLKGCETSMILIMNPDIELDKNCLYEGIRYLRKHSDVSAVSPSARFGDGQKQFLCKRYPSVLNFFLRGFVPKFLQAPFAKRLAKFEMQDLPEEQPTTGIPIISGCFMLCRTAALEAVGGFNEDYFLYFEDFDLSLRLGKHKSLAYLPSMQIVHHGGNSATKGLKHVRYFAASGKQFFSSHGWRWI